MSNLDVYSIFHYDKTQVFVRMDELGLTLDPKDFATNEYQVDEHEHPRTVFKASRRKREVIVLSKEEEEDEEQEKEDCASAGTSQRVENDNVVNRSDDEKYVSRGGDDPPFTGAQLTSHVVDVKVLVRRRNVIAPRTLFVEEPIVEAVDPSSSGPTVETRMAKRARQTHAGSVAGASSSTSTDNFHSYRIHNLEERLDKMNQSQLEMQAQLQKTLAK